MSVCIMNTLLYVFGKVKGYLVGPNRYIGLPILWDDNDLCWAVPHSEFSELNQIWPFNTTIQLFIFFSSPQSIKNRSCKISIVAYLNCRHVM